MSRDGLDDLFTEVYAELEQRARRFLDRERPDHTLEPSALVHEVFTSLVKCERLEWSDRDHFRQIAAKAMRQVLVDHAKARGRQKRGGGAARITLSEATAISPADRIVEIAALNEALVALSGHDAREAEVAHLRLFSGMQLDEIARAVGAPLHSVKNDWKHARAWLGSQLSK